MKLHKRVEEVKESREMEVEFITLEERDRENFKEGFKEGLKEGLEEGKGIIKYFHKGYSINEIAHKLDLSEDIVKKFIQELEAE